ncbi:MAG: exodeoxyribonuclease VII small subunit [Rickettsiales bacterium]|jgi:exodeoxyribonuclease VII small subunit|nr:exodeoxyribonuclease VII small subunit [Rickettsiales bacterium]
MEDIKIDGLSFEQAAAKLDEIVKKMEGGAVSLEESVAAYEMGVKLKERCVALLSAAEQRIEKIKVETGEVEEFQEGK